MRSPFNCEVRCTSGFPKSPSGKVHNGEDYIPTVNKEENWTLYAPCDAKVYISKKQIGSYSGGYGAFGNYIVLVTDELMIVMAHLKTLPLVKSGSRVATGQKIGYAGNTGNSTARHLHIGVANIKGIKYDGASWYKEFLAHLVKPSDYINFKEEYQVRKWTNGSTTEKVYQTTTDCKAQKNSIGSLSPRESCDCYGVVDDCYIVAYKVNGTNAKKVGFVKYKG